VLGRRIWLGIAAALLALSVPSVALAASVPRVSVKRGKHYGARIFPDNAFTIRARSEATGRRVHFRKGLDYPSYKGRVRRACGASDYSICDAFAELNKLDGFDLQPRVTVPFTGGIRLSSVNDTNFFISTRSGKFVSGLRQLTFDPATHTLAGISDKFLREDTRYRIHVTRGILDSHGKHVKACGGSCAVTFTTRTASGELVRIRRSMDLPLSDRRNAYRLAGFPNTAGRKLTFTQNGKADVFLASSVAPSLVDPLNGMIRNDQVKANPKAPAAFSASAVPNLIPTGAAGYFAFGSFPKPSNECGQSALAAAGGPNNSKRRASRNLQIDVAQYRVRTMVAIGSRCASSVP